MSAEGIGKRFGATQALADASLDLIPGQVHVLMGENGSGKSTMVKILSGVHRPDSGTIRLGGAETKAFGSPSAALAAGVVTVFQEILVAPQRSVLDNAWLGYDGLLGRREPAEGRRELAREILSRLIKLPNLDRPAERLGLNDRQAVCIARALLRKPQVLILDEATSALDISTRDNLFGILDELRGDGVAILFISHRMDEVERIADQVSVMRTGRTVGTSDRGNLDSRKLVELMVGSGHPEDVKSAEQTTRTARDEVTVRVSGLRLSAAAEPINCDFRAGEIVGVAGLEGHGQHEFLQALSGSRAPEGAVSRVRDGQDQQLRSRGQALKSGIAYVPRDRRDEGIFPTLPVLENFGISSPREDVRGGLVSRKATRTRFAAFVEQLHISTPHPQERITTLSGGNQQKVVIARWLARNPQVLVLNDPTRGVDLGAKRDIYRVLTETAAAGTTVIMLSTELIELVEFMDRVLVFREGSVVSEIGHADITRERLVASYFGREVQ